MKKILIIIVGVLVVLVVGAFVIMKSRSSQTPPASTTDNNKPVTPQPAKTKLDPAKIIMGEVISAQSGQVQFKSNNTEYTAEISGTTRLFKQVTGTDGAVTQAPATLADFTKDKTIVVYFDSPVENGIYKQVSIIQIIN